MTGAKRVGLALVLLWAVVWCLALGGACTEDLGAQVAAVVLLLVGSTLIFVSLVRMDRPAGRSWSFPRHGRRLAGVDARRTASALPPRIDVAPGPTAPPPAGGRARLLEMRGMGRTRRGL